MAHDDITVIFVPGQPVILTADSRIDFDRFRPLDDGEEMIRLPSFSRPASGRWVVPLHNSPPLDALPVGAKLVFATYALGDLRSRQPDGLTVMFYDVPTGTAMSFLAGDNCALTTTEGGSLSIAPPWESVTLTKTGETSWALATA